MLNDNRLVIERYGDPVNFDTAPWLSLCVNKSDDSVWIQLSKEEQMQWVRFDTLEEAHKFMKELDAVL